MTYRTMLDFFFFFFFVYNLDGNDRELIDSGWTGPQ